MGCSATDTHLFSAERCRTLSPAASRGGKHVCSEGRFQSETLYRGVRMRGRRRPPSWCFRRSLTGACPISEFPSDNVFDRLTLFYSRLPVRFNQSIDELINRLRQEQIDFMPDV